MSNLFSLFVPTHQSFVALDQTKMSRTFTVLLLMMIFMEQPTDSSYIYAGCYTHAFHDTFFTSSFMEPTLCFRLCETPIMYLQGTVCRCSGAGVMHAGRQNDSLCNIPCTKPVDRGVNTANTCGGTLAYSVYVKEHFYSLYGHLINYQINFASCELWNDSTVVEAYSVRYDKIVNHSSLNRLERCAAACLDQDSSTISIGKCILCIIFYNSSSYPQLFLS